MCARVSRSALLSLLLLASASGAPAQVPDIKSQSALPIDLDAASSAFDRRNDRIVFEQLRISQGSLTITADSADAARIDFENNRWHFHGNVVIDNLGARVLCDDAELIFVGHQLRSATLTGEPARFAQARGGGKRTEGTAGKIDYDVAGGIVRLSGGAWLSDGANEVTGDRITYDLQREYVTANAEGNGQVRMKINPPARDAKGRPAP